MMELFWDRIVAPLLDAADARVIAEIGVDYGDTTRRLTDRAARLGGGLVHAIDPAPSATVDVDALVEASAGHLRFHQVPSHEALPGIGAVDAALVDGDHNWHTVIGELRLLAEAAAARSMPLPLVLAHDVGWPYGRRDMYYDPAAIPAEDRHPAAREGMVPGRSELDPEGMNPWLWNAAHEGGPRNGVLTAIEDFVSEYPESCELLVVDGFHGLGILVSAGRDERSPELRGALDRLRSAEFARDWARTLEWARVDGYLQSWRAMGKPSPPDADLERWAGTPTA
jgi:hypothetical protein